MRKTKNGDILQPNVADPFLISIWCYVISLVMTDEVNKKVLVLAEENDKLLELLDAFFALSVQLLLSTVAGSFCLY